MSKLLWILGTIFSLFVGSIIGWSIVEFYYSIFPLFPVIYKILTIQINLFFIVVCIYSYNRFFVEKESYELIPSGKNEYKVVVK